MAYLNPDPCGPGERHGYEAWVHVPEHARVDCLGDEWRKSALSRVWPTTHSESGRYEEAQSEPSSWGAHSEPRRPQGKPHSQKEKEA